MYARTKGHTRNHWWSSKRVNLDTKKCLTSQIDDINTAIFFLRDVNNHNNISNRFICLKIIFLIRPAAPKCFKIVSFNDHLLSLSQGSCRSVANEG